MGPLYSIRMGLVTRKPKDLRAGIYSPTTNLQELSVVAGRCRMLEMKAL